MPGERFIVRASESTPEEDASIFGGSCQDINGRTIAAGNHYVPGPDSCTVCLCDEGRPKWCQAVLCAAPKDCKSFRIGSSCCEFICLDETEGPDGDTSVDVTWGEGGWIGGDLGLRLIATAVTAVLSLALLAFLFYRLKRRRGTRNSACHDDLDGEGMPSSSLASYDHGDITNSTGHLSRQPGPMVNVNDQQSPLYLMWKLPTVAGTTDNPPPYTETAGHSTAHPPEEEHQETTGLLAVPSAPPALDLEGEPTMLVLGQGSSTVSVLVRRSNGTLDSEFIDAGTPPPSYAEVLASISSTAVDQAADEQDASAPSGSSERRSSASLPRQRTAAASNGLLDPAIQRFSLQLALDYSDDTSSSLSSSTASVDGGHAGARPLSFSSSSSAASLAQH